MNSSNIPVRNCSTHVTMFIYSIVNKLLNKAPFKNIYLL